MSKKPKNKKTIKSTAVRGLTGHGVIAKLFGVTLRWVSKVLTGEAKDSKGYEYELDRYIKFQNAYIERRKQELGIETKNITNQG